MIARSAGIDEPLRLTPVLVPKPWGGQRLTAWSHDLPPGERIGEAWVVADLDADAVSSVVDPVSRVADGPLRGTTLRELIAMDELAFLGRADSVDGRFPLLVKLLDAREHLSVQLHPHAAYAAEDPSVAVKTETWVVLEADPGSQLMLGLQEGVTYADVVEAVGTPSIVPMLRSVPAVVGDVHHLPAGMVHALGAGVVVAEVQTPSDTTFRLYDWTAEYERPERAIHRDAVARCLELTAAGATGSEPEVEVTPNSVTAPSYVLARRALADGASLTFETGVVKVVVVLDGTLAGTGTAGPWKRGQTLVLPAAWSGELQAQGETVVLETEPTPSARE